MTPEEQKKYEVQPQGFWLILQMRGCTGYDAMAFAEENMNWEAIGGWGKDGWNLGYWPYVIIFFRDRENSYDVIEYCEGDVNMWACPTAEIREEITNGLAFYHWKHNEYSAPPRMYHYQSVDDLPDELKGPYRD